MATISNEDEWRPDCTDIGSTDDIIVAQTGRCRKIFNVHKVVLSDGSPKLEEMLHQEPPENGMREIDDDPEAFELLLKHFYGERMEISSVRHVWQFYTLGNKYEVPYIFHVAKQHFESITITEDKFWEVVESGIFSHPLFHDKMTYFIKENAESIIKTEKIFNVPEKFISDLLQMEALNAEEHDILEAVTEWAYRNMEEANSESLLKFYRQIRFATLRYDTFYDFTQCYPKALDQKSKLTILFYLHSTQFRTLPEWCSTNHLKRKNVYLFQRRTCDIEQTNDFT